jgi:NADH-ubiquinone oxidoreductase chain 5
MRFSYVFEASSTSLLIVTWLGGLSALFGAAAGVVENDLKKVIAYSTTSQLGYMVVACGLSQYNLALFHLINHALFKALLFLSAGAVIYLIDQQDLRKMGSLV